ncbi:MAG: hypothetical protein D6693_04925 [Planctomycetota bacterium]|nr:MAG: hypothetical protein D6693_04925 [Planctomycetota bacterium]
MASDSVRIMCPNLTCRRVLSVPEEARGRSVRCRGCGSTIRVPAKPSQPSEKPAGGAPADAA